MEIDGRTVEPPTIEWMWKRWEPRFAAAGVDFNILQKLHGEISTWDEWCQRWCAVGDDLWEFAQEAADRGDLLTAGESWARASLQYQFGGMYYIWDMEQFDEAERRRVEAYRLASPLLPAPGTRVEVPFEGGVMPAIVRNPRTDDRPAPVVLLYNGFEGTKEESEGRVRELHARGLATVSWDGPGRGEALHHIPMNGDYGPATTALLDALAEHPEFRLDLDNVGAVGPNRGAFVALKAAASEPRLRAIAATSPGYDRRGTDLDDLYQVAFEMSLFHLTSIDELVDRINQPDLCLEGDVERIGADVCLIAGGRDEGRQFEGSKRLFDELQGHKEWTVIEDAERNGNNVPFKIRPLMADFLARRLGA